MKYYNINVNLMTFLLCYHWIPKLNLQWQTPVHTIASNAGVEGAVVVGKLLEQDNPDLGYDAAKGQWFFSS